MNNAITSIAWVLSCTLWLTPIAEAKETASTGKTTSARRAKASRVPVPMGYGESRKERDQRLTRECKGRPNTGACEGFAN